MKENAWNVDGFRRTWFNAVSDDIGATQIVAMLIELGRPRRLEYRIVTVTMCGHVFVGVQQVRLSFGDGLSKPEPGVRRQLSPWRQDNPISRG